MHEVRFGPNLDPKAVARYYSVGMDKAEVARRQLGTALEMFLREQDPVSVHSLAVAGGELAEQLVNNAGAQPFVGHVLKTFPDMDVRQIRTLQRKFSNAFKHATTRDGRIAKTQTS